MKAWRTTSFIACAFVALLAAPVGAAEAMAPTYLSSEPEDGAKLERAPERVEVTFDEPLDEGSDLSVKDECGRTVDAGDAQVEANTIRVELALKPAGVYEVTYFAKGVGGLTGQETGTFDFTVRKGPSCGDGPGGHGGHGGDNEGNEHGGGNHGGGNHGGGNHGSGSGDQEHSGSTGHGSGGSGTDHASMDHDSTPHSGSGGSGRHNGGKDGSKHGPKHGSKRGGGHGKHGKGGIAGAHGLLDILEKNERKEERALAVDDGIPVAPDGQAVSMALALSLLMGVLGGWFLRVSGGR